MDEGAVTLRRWMITIGIIYLVMGVRLLPFVNGPMIEAAGVEAIYHGGDLEVGTSAYRFVLAWMGTFGASLIPMGAVLLLAARDPLRNRLFAHLVIGHELLAGVAADAWYIAGGDVSTPFYLGFIAFHLVIIATGIRALRRTAPSPELRPLRRSRVGSSGVTADGRPV